MFFEIQREESEREIAQSKNKTLEKKLFDDYLNNKISIRELVSLNEEYQILYGLRNGI
jgi:hypothetical protein